MAGNNNVARFALVATACVFLATTLHLALEDKATAAMVTAATSAGLLVFAFLPVFESIEAFGILVKIRGQIDRAEDLLEQLREGALISAELAAQQLSWSDRLGGAPREQRLAILVRYEKYLADIGVADEKATELKTQLFTFLAQDVVNIWDRLVNQRIDALRNNAQSEINRLKTSEIEDDKRRIAELENDVVRWKNHIGLQERDGTRPPKEDMVRAMEWALDQYPFPADDRETLSRIAHGYAEAVQECKTTATITPKVAALSKVYDTTEIYEGLFGKR